MTDVKSDQVTVLSRNKCFEGTVLRCSHESTSTKCTMKFHVFLPPGAESRPAPVIYWLSGLTCTDENFIFKAGAQRYAAEAHVALVCPDTSPRDCNIEGESKDYDFGTGAGFYVDATEPKWSTNYNMYSYVTKELPALVAQAFPGIAASSQSIMGHSMGGHGALICALKNPGAYRSVSAFAPICHPTQCPWGVKAFTGYLGSNGDSDATWRSYDATLLATSYSGPPLELFVDQGSADKFLTERQLLPDALESACHNHTGGITMRYRLQDGYDHSYFFIATFIEDHIKHHAQHLHAST